MREPTFLVLAALADGPRHGYAVIREVAEISGGRVTMRPGTLYGALDRLAGDGLVRVEREEVVDGRLRRYYTLTEDGAGALAAQTERLRANVAEAERRLRLRARRGEGPATAFGSATAFGPATAFSPATAFGSATVTATATGFAVTAAAAAAFVAGVRSMTV